VTREARKVLEEKEFMEVHSPKIIVEGGSGGSESFRIRYFGENALLAQSPQLYHQILMGSLERVFEIGPSFRAQNYSTQRHVNEMSSLDVSLAFPESLKELQTVATDLVRSMVFAGLSDTPGIVEIPYTEAMNLIGRGQTNRMSGPEKSDIYKKLSPQGDKLVVVERTPSSTTNFTVKSGSDGLSENFKIIYKNQEICSGSIRISDYEEITESMERHGINKDDFGSLIEAYKCGLPPHGGFSLGINRLVASILGTESIKEVISFPRDPRRLKP